MERKEIGKIKSVRFGHGGYQDAMFGLTVDLGSDSGWGVGDFISGFWDPEMERSEHAKWTEEERGQAQIDMVRRIAKLMSQAKVHDVMKLVGKPVEVTFDGMMLKSWRILTEAL